MSVATDLVPILALALNIHIASIPIAVLRHTLRTPMRPDAKLGVAIPFRRVIAEQRVPVRLKRPVAGQIGNVRWRLQWHTVPCAWADAAAVGAKPQVLNRLAVGDAETGGRTAA